MRELEHVVASQSQLGEGPLWVAREQALYWLDIREGRVERLRPATGERESFSPPAPITALGIRASGGFVVASRAGLAFWSPSSPNFQILGHPERHLSHNRFNDAAVGPDGSFWAGTMYEGPDDRPAEPGSLYRLGCDSSIRRQEAGLTISNGLGWSPDRRTMYLTDTLRRTIYAYRFDPASGEITDRQIFIHDDEEPGFPDGLAIDEDGCLWSARWGGWRVLRYDPDGRVMERIATPFACASSCAFGGADLDELYITSAWLALSSAERGQQPEAGDLFRARPGVRGQPAYEFAG